MLAVASAAPFIDPLIVVQQQIDNLDRIVVPILIPIGFKLGLLVSVLMLWLNLVKSLGDLLLGKSIQAIVWDLLGFLLRIWLVSIELVYYGPLTDLFSAAGRYIASTIDVSSLTVLLDLIANFIDNLQKPAIYDGWQLVLYYFELISMSGMDTLLFLVTAAGFFFVGLGLIFGPILIPLQLTPWFQHKFWGWVNFMITYNMYRAVACAFTAIWSNVMIHFFQNLVGHNYDLGTMSALFSIQVVLVVGGIVLAFGVPYAAHELFGHSGSAAPAFGSSMRGLAYLLLR